MKIGFAELLVVLVVAMLILGPEKLPDYAKKLGKGLAEFRRASNEAANAFSKSCQAPPEASASPHENRAAPPEGRKEKTNPDSGKNCESD